MTTEEKLDNIIIPELDFEDAPLAFVLDWLRLESYRLDEEEHVPARRGVNIGWLLSDEKADKKLVTISFHDCDLRTGLGWIAEQAGLELFINEGGVYLRLPPFTDYPEGFVPRPYDERVRMRRESAARAIALCPAVNDVDSPEGRTFKHLFEHCQATNDPILHCDEVPYYLALAAMEIVGRQKRGERWNAKHGVRGRPRTSRAANAVVKADSKTKKAVTT